ncbi:malto-oligosyltrehalose trehalohydrolase [uncultured Paracoccus sp.]|uniref:malto-oligosyltrehalose trehalohydrolase n=1 Tax=uncultured Paracoccus sp. TaxID=189685 RepID=UPI002628A02F|nr:malto-oligosyltrehalose trehalohydrolase [uncultured Paracoccus sp.]
MTADRYTWGAVPRAGTDQWSLRLWAPDADAVAVSIGGADHPMRAAEGSAHTGDPGWFTLDVAAPSGTAYAFVMPDGLAVPDPAARRQENGVHGPSLLTPPRMCRGWCDRPWEEAVIYELHVGTFTEAGTFRAAAAEFSRLAALGFTAIEIMPVAQFAGDRGWGYDGVLPYAPHPAYGTPDDLAAMVETAHDHGLIVLLDVVYNHFGPDGNYLHAYAERFFDAARQTPWGAGIDYTRRPVRRFFIENALYWLGEFGFDGLRLDAIDQIVDPSEPELLVEMAGELRARLPGCPVHLTTEDNRNVTHLHERRDGVVVGYTAEWNDDFHNAAHVLATGETEGYYAAFASDPLGQFGRALAEGFAFQGEDGRGEPSAHLPPVAFVDFLQNHDQTGNRARGERLISLTDADTLEALGAIHLLSPHIPLMFMGEEYGETRPFLFFAGFEGDLAAAVREGRRREFAGFTGFEGTGVDVPDPIDRQVMEASRLDPSRRDSPAGQGVQDRVRRLLDLRRTRIVPHLRRAGGYTGTVLKAADGVLAVDWRLGDALLQLRAAFPGAPRDMLPAAGVELHRTAPGAAATAVHFLKEA